MMMTPPGQQCADPAAFFVWSEAKSRYYALRIPEELKAGEWEAK